MDIREFCDRAVSPQAVPTDCGDGRDITSADVK
jgi:hypothetical protein